ncbi:MAG: tryptophan--tRNA ligase [Myxococcales bacterium]|nr:tryptophan--tRNA ligase [Myxococcales bacterium]
MSEQPLPSSSTAKPRILSGMQPTGGLHIGNYLGALKNWVNLVNAGDHEALFCIVDAHAITIDYDPKELRQRILDAAVSYIAAGLDPAKCTIFVQSDVPQHTELAWYLSAVTPMGDLNRMTQFKEKSDEHKENVNAGLFTYPILMAADILVYRATVVPVGDDQVQHLELTREIARRFNHRFKPLFPEPKPLLSKAPRIMGVDGKTKMSKSRGNSIDLLDTPRAVEKKLKSAYTDPNKLRQGDAGNPDICNIFTIHQSVSPEPQVLEIDRDCRLGTLGCGDCKAMLNLNLNQELEPIRERAQELANDKKRVLEILDHGREQASRLAERTMRDVRKTMGLGTTHYKK